MRNIYYNKSSNNPSVQKSTKKESEDRITAPNAIEGNRSSGSNPNESDACDQCVEISENHTHSELSLTTIVLVFPRCCVWLLNECVAVVDVHAKWRPHSVCNVHVIKLKCYVCLAADVFIPVGAQKKAWKLNSFFIEKKKLKTEKDRGKRVKMFVKNDKNAFRRWSAMVCSINFLLVHRQSPAYAMHTRGMEWHGMIHNLLKICAHLHKR